MQQEEEQEDRGVRIKCLIKNIIEHYSKTNLLKIEGPQSPNSRILAAEFERKSVDKFVKELMQLLIKSPTDFESIQNNLSKDIEYEHGLISFILFLCVIMKYKPFYNALEKHIKRENIAYELPPIENKKSYDRQNLGIQQLLKSHTEVARVGVRKETLKSKALEPKK